MRAVCLKPRSAGWTYNRAMDATAADAFPANVAYDEDGLVP
jgi:hypothetical protein